MAWLAFCVRQWRALALVTCVVATLGSAEAARAEQLFGFNEASNHNELSPAADDRLARLEAAAGGEIHRVVVSWKDVEQDLVNGTPVQDWRYYDRAIGSIRAAGMRPLIVIMNAPKWAQAALECQGPICPPAPSKLSQWARFAYDVTRRYPEAVAIEVWNEPNGRGQWNTSAGPDPERYAQLFSHAAGAIHYADATMPVLVGSVTYWPKDEPRHRMTIPTFAERFYRAGGASQLRPGDGWGLHAYPWTNELETLDGQFATIMRQARQSLARFDPGRRIWITETGVTTTGKWAVSERAQAKGILTLKRKVPTMDDVRSLLIHSTVEAPFNRHHLHEPGYGLIRRSDLSPKIAYCALAELAGADRSFTGCPP